MILSPIASHKCQLAAGLLLLFLFLFPNSGLGAQEEEWQHMDDSTLLLTGERLVKDEKALEAGYRAFRILTNRHSGHNITDPATRQLIAKAYNWRAIITLTYSHDYPTAMRLFIKALDYSDNNVSPALANNIAHLFNLYAQCLPTADNIRRALDMYHAAFHAAIETKDWEEGCNAFVNIVDFGFEPWICDYNKAMADSFKYLAPGKGNPLYKEAAVIHDMLQHSHQRRWKESASDAQRLAKLFMETNSKDTDRLLGYAYKLMSTIAEASGNPDSLILHAQRLLGNTYRTKDLSNRQHSYRMLSKGFQMLGHKADTDKYQLLALSTKDSILVYYQLNNAHNGILYNKLEMAISQASKAKHNLEMTHIEFVITAIASLVVLVLLWKVYAKYFNLKKRNRDLALNMSELERQHEASSIPPGADKPKYASNQLSDEEKGLLKRQIDEILRNADYISRCDFSLSSLAAACNSSVKSISQVINASYGRTFPAILTEARVKLACRRISESDVYDKFTIEGIATDIGFNSRGGFVRAFKNATGSTPSDFINSAKARRLLPTHDPDEESIERS